MVAAQVAVLLGIGQCARDGIVGDQGNVAENSPQRFPPVVSSGGRPSGFAMVRDHENERQPWPEMKDHEATG